MTFAKIINFNSSSRNKFRFSRNNSKNNRIEFNDDCKIYNNDIRTISHCFYTHVCVTCQFNIMKQTFVRDDVDDFSIYFHFFFFFRMIFSCRHSYCELQRIFFMIFVSMMNRIWISWNCWWLNSDFCTCLNIQIVISLIHSLKLFVNALKKKYDDISHVNENFFIICFFIFFDDLMCRFRCLYYHFLNHQNLFLSFSRRSRQ